MVTESLFTMAGRSRVGERPTDLDKVGQSSADILNLYRLVFVVVSTACKRAYLLALGAAVPLASRLEDTRIGFMRFNLLCITNV